MKRNRFNLVLSPLLRPRPQSHHPLPRLPGNNDHDDDGDVSNEDDDLVLLVLGHEVVHVGLSLGELHLVHALAGVPVEEGLAPGGGRLRTGGRRDGLPEHHRELLTDPLEQLLGDGVVQVGTKNIFPCKYFTQTKLQFLKLDDFVLLLRMY